MDEWMESDDDSDSSGGEDEEGKNKKKKDGEDSNDDSKKKKASKKAKPDKKKKRDLGEFYTNYCNGRLLYFIFYDIFKMVRHLKSRMMEMRKVAR